MPDATSRRHYIRFQLDELSAANGHHTFEDICREVARARIASNLLPATGPVSSGGDAGRDFETFTSYLPRKLGEHSAFAARVSDKRLAFLCTLQKEGVTTKFERDIETIAASGDTFDKVYAMSAVPISVGSRNRLRKKVRERHGIELEVLDGVWLAEQLADHDLFWVAERYLSVPAHMAPPPPAGPADETPEWYAEELARWHERGELQATVRDILDAKRGLRYATFHDNGRKDLRFWLGLFEPLTAHEHPRVVRQRARYEYAVATLRGAGELRPADAAVRAFFSDALAEEHTARLKDAAVLVAYATGAYGRNLTDLDAVYLRDINDQLRARIQALLDQDPPPTRRALLLDALGFLALLPDPGRLAPPPAPVRVDGADYLDAEGNFTAPEPLTPPEESPLVDLDTGMNAWVELAESLDTARLFPVDELAKLVNLSAPLLVSDRRWRRLVDAVEAAVRRSSGDAAAGENARRRAERLLDAGQLRAALGELHEAKVNWWSGDHLQEALMAMLLISSIYRQLGMMQAAKQYALAATRAAVVSGRDDLRRFVPEGLLSAADCDCLSGAWCNAVDLYELGFTAANAVSDLDEDSLTPRAGNFALILRSASVLACQLEAPIREAMRRCGMAELVDVIGELPQPTAEEVVGSADRDLHGRPFADTSEQRVIRFVALGLDWTVRCENLYEHVLVAERFVAAAQVLLVELADKDLCLLKTTLDIHVAPAAAGRKGEAAPEPATRAGAGRSRSCPNLTRSSPAAQTRPSISSNYWKR